MILKREMSCNGELRWVDMKTGRPYRRAVIGLVWPGQLPGFACVVAEDFFREARAELYNLHVLKELEVADLGFFISRLHELAENYQVSELLGDPEHKPAREFLYRHNAELAKQERMSLSISRAALHGEASQVEYVLRTVQARLRSGSKSLFFGEGSSLPGRLLEFRPPAITTAKPGEYPAQVALGFAVAAFERSGISIEIPGRTPTKAITDYDPFAYDKQNLNRRF